MIELEYKLSEATGEKLRDMEAAAEAANIVGLLDGDGMMYTTLGHNMQSRLASSPLRREAHLDQGGFSLSDAPYISGAALCVPRMLGRKDGDSFLLEGPEANGSQLFDLSPLSDGTYAVVLETWLALVGPTTYGKASRPAQYAGVVDTSRKPSAYSLYPAGNIDRLGIGVPDESFVTATIQTQKMLQRQYRIRLIPERNLVGLPSYLGLSARYSGTGDIVKATAPRASDAYDLAMDREFLACKLALVTVNSGTYTALVNAPHRHLKAEGIVQSPVPVIPTARRFQSFVTCEIERLDVSDAVLGDRIHALEKLSDGAVYAAERQAIQSNTDQRIFFTTEVRDALGWHDNTTVSNRFVMDFEGSLLLICHGAFAAGGTAGTIDGTRGLALYINNKDAGLRVMNLALGGVGMGVQLTCEIDVKPGDLLEIAAPHTSVKTDLDLIAARLTMRRTS